MKRQIKLLIALFVVVALSVAGYFMVDVFVPEEEPAVEEKDPVQLEDGEALLGDKQVFMFDALTRKDIETITVDNEFGGFVFENNGKGEFFIQGYDSVVTDETLFATLLNVASYSLSKVKVGSDLSDAKIAEYGLDNPQASWTVKGYDDSWYKVYVGDRILPGQGYYCMLDGRRSVYVLSENIESTVLVPVENYVTPVLCGGISQNDYFTVDDYTIYNYGEMLFSLERVPKDEQENPGALAEVIMDYPTAYYPNTDLYFELLYSYMSLFADSCYKLGASAEDIEAAGVGENCAHRITFEYNGAVLDLRFSELTEDGTYYCWSNMSPNLIGLCDGDKFYYLENRLIDWINPHMFLQYITNLESFKVITENRTVDFEFTHSTASDGDPILHILANGENMSKEDVLNFRQYYQTFYVIAVHGYCDEDESFKLSEEEKKALISDESNAYLTFSYKTLSGEEKIYSFYQYSTGHTLITVNGIGEFYVLDDTVRKVINDTERLMNSEPIEAFGKN